MSKWASPSPEKKDPRSTCTKQCLLCFSWMTSLTPDGPWFMRFQPRMQPSSRGLIWHRVCSSWPFRFFVSLFILSLSSYRLDDIVSTVWQTGDVDFGLQLPVDWSKETLWTVDTHHSFIADLHTDAVLQFINRDLCVKMTTTLLLLTQFAANEIQLSLKELDGASVLFVD